MKKKILMMMVAAFTLAFGARAQVTTDPSPLEEDSQNVVIYFHADQGNQALMNMDPQTHIYAHTGVQVVNAAGTVTDWKYAPAWEEDNEKYRLEYVSSNLWKLYIGDIRTFYGVADNETVTKLCFVFRNTGGTLEGKTASGGDIFVDVNSNAFQLKFTPGKLASVITAPEELSFRATPSVAADIKIYVNNTLIGEAKGVTTYKASYNFDKVGDYEIKCVATAEGKTLVRYLHVTYARNAQPAANQTVPPMGVTKNSDGTYTFCVAAPLKENVMVIGSWNNYSPSVNNVMDYIDKTVDDTPIRYFTVNLPSKTTGTEFGYYYLVDGATSVGDPYAVLVLDPSNDKYISPEVYPNMPAYPEEYVTNNPVIAWYGDKLLDYKWNVEKFWGAKKDNLVIYEMLFRDFTGTEGQAKGNGTVRQAIEKLDYIKNLGVNAVELLPINEFNGNNSWGYNPNFYFAIDKAYGTPQDYKEFIDKCHQLGIAVILDVVFNQSDGQHPWYQMYGGIRNSPFYNYGLGGENGAPHAYSVLNDWNQGYPLVEQQWKDVVKFWLSEYKVDGFRFDLVKGLGDNTSYANAGDAATNRYNASRVARMKRIHDAMREVNPAAYFINENLAGAQEENEMAQDGELNWANVNDPGCQYAMGYQSNASLNRMWALRDGRTAGSTVAYLESHDEQRLAYKQETWGVAGVKDNHAAAMQRCGSAAAQMLLVPGSHMIWMFSEMGNAQSTKSDNGGNNTSPKIVNWNLLDDPDNNGLMENYSELIKFRRYNPYFFAADSNYRLNFSSWTEPRYAHASYEDKEFFLVTNPSVTEEMSLNMEFMSNSNDDYFIYSKSYGSEPSFDAAAGVITVPANCYVVIATENLAGIEKPVNDNRKAYIYPMAGAIRVAYNEGEVNVYTLDGARVATATGEATIPVNPGMYVVRAGDTSAKVLVR